MDGCQSRLNRLAPVLFLTTACSPFSLVARVWLAGGLRFRRPLLRASLGADWFHGLGAVTLFLWSFGASGLAAFCTPYDYSSRRSRASGFLRVFCVLPPTSLLYLLMLSLPPPLQAFYSFIGFAPLQLSHSQPRRGVSGTTRAICFAPSVHRFVVAHVPALCYSAL